MISPSLALHARLSYRYVVSEGWSNEDMYTVSDRKND